MNSGAPNLLVNELRSILTPAFRKLYADLPGHVQQLAREKYLLFQSNPSHPSLEFKAKGSVWTVAIGRSYRAIGRRKGNDIHWIWIGSHDASEPQIKLTTPLKAGLQGNGKEVRSASRLLKRGHPKSLFRGPIGTPSL